MAYTIGLIGIKASPSDQILDVVSNYYKNHNLTLVEERIGNKTGKYANSKKLYKDLKEYQDDAYPQSKPYFTTNFDLYENLDENKNWKIFVYYPDAAIQSTEVSYTININYELAQLLSEKLQTTTLQYEFMNIVDNYRIKKYTNGVLVDQLSAGEGEIFIKKGYFERILVDDIFNEIEKYCNENLFYPDGADIDMLYNENQRRPMYLKGHPDDIKKFFHYQGKFSE